MLKKGSRLSVIILCCKTKDEWQELSKMSHSEDILKIKNCVKKK